MRTWVVTGALLLLTPLTSAGALGGDGEVHVVPAGGRYFAGERLQRHVSCRLGGRPGDKVVCRWGIALFDDQVVESGSLELTPAQGTAHGKFVTTMPNVPQRLPLTFAVRVYAGDQAVAGEETQEAVFPDKPVLLDSDRGEKARIGLFDPSGATARVLARMGVAFTPLSSHLGLQAFRGDVIIVGEGGAFARAPASLSLAVQRARKGASVLVLAQADWPPRHLRPPWLSPPGEVDFDLAARLSTHPDLIGGLLPGDLSRWRLRTHPQEEGLWELASWRAFPAPVKGNFRLHLSVPGGGMGRSCLMEYLVGDGRMLLSTLPVVAAYDGEPVARVMMRNLLLLATASVTKWKRTALWGDPEGEPVRWLGDLGVQAQLNAVNLGEVDVLLVDGTSAPAKAFPKHQAEMLEALERFVRGGGLALILGLTEERLNDYRPLLPERLSLRAAKVEQVLFERKESFLWGVPQETLKKLVGGCESIDIPEFERGEKERAVTEPPVVARFSRGEGEVLLVQIPFWGLADNKEGASRLLSQMLTNLGVSLAEPGER